MTEQKSSPKPPDPVPPDPSPPGASRPDVVVRKRSGPGIVWLVPIVAVAIGAWLGIRTLLERGPGITLTFQNADRRPPQYRSS